MDSSPEPGTTASRKSCDVGADLYADLADPMLDGADILDRLMADHGSDPGALAQATQPLDGRQRNMLDAAISLRFGRPFASEVRQKLTAADGRAQRDEGVLPDPPKEDGPEAREQEARLNRFKELQTETELVGVRTLAELKLGRSLGPDELDGMRSLVRERVNELHELARLAEARRYWEAEQRKWQAQAFIARQRERGLEPLGDSVEPRGLGGEMWEQVKRLGEVPGVIKDGTVAFVEEHGERSQELARDAFDRGNVLGPAFAPLVVAGQMELEAVDAGLTQATESLEQAIAARDGYDRAIAGAMAVLGLGSAALSAYGLAEPIAALTGGGGAGMASGGAAAVLADGGTVAVAGARSVAAPLSIEGITASVTGQSIRYEQDEIAGEYVNETEHGRGDDKMDHVTPEEIVDAQAMHEASAREAGVKSGVQHHVFPQEQKPYFEAHGIDIHDFCVTLDESDHQAIHGGGDYKLARKVWPHEWNQLVMTELRRVEAAERRATGKLLSPEQVIQVGKRVMTKNDIPIDFERYAKAPKRQPVRSGGTKP